MAKRRRKKRARPPVEADAEAAAAQLDTASTEGEPIASATAPPPTTAEDAAAATTPDCHPPGHIPTAAHTAAQTHFRPGLHTPEERRRHIAKLMARRLANQPIAREDDYPDGADDSIEMSPVVDASFRLSSARTFVRVAGQPAEKLPENFPARIRVLRKRLRLTVVALALRCELSVSAIERLENGTRRPSLGTVMALARSLGVSLPVLVGGVEGKLG